MRVASGFTLRLRGVTSFLNQKHLHVLKMSLDSLDCLTIARNVPIGNSLFLP
jgi:hypothetical protein